MKISLKILGWNKHNSGNFKLKYKHWFKNKADIIYSAGLFGLSAGQKWLWIYILAQCCAQNNEDTVCINVQHAIKTTDLTEFEVYQAINILAENDTIKVLGDTVLPELTLDSKKTPIDKIRLDKSRLEKNREEEIIKTICTEPKNSSVAVLTEKVKKSDFKDFFNTKLLELYPQEYLDREKVKMEIWLVNNPLKNPKSQRGWTRFITGWLERGFDSYRKSLTTQEPKKKTWQELADEREAAKNG